MAHHFGLRPHAGRGTRGKHGPNMASGGTENNEYEVGLGALLDEPRKIE